jgi:hypothetical protein
MAKCFGGRSGHNGMYGGWIYKVVYLPMQSVPITTNVSSNLAHGDGSVALVRRSISPKVR